MNNFIKKKVGPFTLGEKMQEMRNERRFSLEEISKATQIQSRYLEYLERGEYDKLPVEVYVKGFLKNYAAFFGVDSVSLIKLYEREKDIRENIKKRKKEKINHSIFLKAPKINNFVFSSKAFISVLAFIFVLAGFFYIYREVDRFVSYPRLVILSPADGVETDENLITVEGITDKDVQILINNQATIVDDEGKFKEEVTLLSGVNSIKVEAKNRFGKKAEKSFLVKSNYVSEVEKMNMENGGEFLPLQEGEVKGAEIMSHKISLYVTEGPVWVVIKADDNPVYEGNIYPQTIQNFSVKEKMIINSGREKVTWIQIEDQEPRKLEDFPARGKDRILEIKKENFENNN